MELKKFPKFPPLTPVYNAVGERRREVGVNGRETKVGGQEQVDVNCALGQGVAKNDGEVCLLIPSLEEEVENLCKKLGDREEQMPKREVMERQHEAIWREKAEARDQARQDFVQVSNKLIWALEKRKGWLDGELGKAQPITLRFGSRAGCTHSGHSRKAAAVVGMAAAVVVTGCKLGRGGRCCRCAALHGSCLQA